MIRSFATILFGALITLHTPSGREVFVNADEIMVIQQPIDNQWPIKGQSCGAELVIHDRWKCVRETPNEVKALVEGAKQ